MGGFDSEDQASLDVDIYDMRSDSWSKGPPLPGNPRNGFSPAACSINGTIYVSVGTGEMFRLSADQQSWEPHAKTTPRVVHRLIPNGSEILVVGGAAESRMLDLVEAVPVR